MADHGQTKSHLHMGGRAVTGCSTAMPTLRTWTYLKNRLSLCRVMQDGDDEGCLRLFDLPTPEQAVLVF